jgi:L-lactate dehydrogenase complex protein LldG
VGVAVSARDEVLARVRRAAGDAAAPTVGRDYRRADATPADLDLFADRLRDYKAQVHRCPAAAVHDLLASVLSGRVVVPPGFPREWLRDGDWVQDDGLSARELDALDGVVTTCALAVAETGTIVLDGGPGQGRRAVTLVPDRHVVVVRSDQVVQTVPQALALLDPRRPQTWVSGPSATSDIELQRVEGVHGPRTLVVVLVEE